MKIKINGQPPSVLKLATALTAAEGSADDRTMKPHDVYSFFEVIDAKLNFIRREYLEGTQISFFGCYPTCAEISPLRFTAEATCFKARHNGSCWVIYEIFRAPGRRPNTEINFSALTLRALQEFSCGFDCW